MLRALRAVAILAFIGLLAYVVLDRERAPDLTLAFLLVGAVLFGLGYDVALRVPGFLERKPAPSEDDDDE